VIACAVTVGRSRFPNCALPRTDAISLHTPHCYCACVWARRMNFPIAWLLVSAVLLCRNVGVVLAARPINDVCSNATPIVVGDILPGTTNEATRDFSFTTCTNFVGKSQPRQPFPPRKVSRHGCICDLLTKKDVGVWYTTTGTGERLVAKTCGKGTQFDTFIAVFSACSAWTGTCIAFDDNSCNGGTSVTDNGGKSVVEWNSVLGKNYRILVRGVGNSKGNFKLRLFAATAAPSSQPSSKPSATVRTRT
jgi:hypothetical protein